MFLENYLWVFLGKILDKIDIQQFPGYSGFINLC